jgi:hypothetical protein
MDLNEIQPRKSKNPTDWPQQPFHEAVLNSALQTIDEIDPKIHRISLSGAYELPEIRKRFGALNHATYNWLEKYYEERHFRTFPHFNVSVFVGPKYPPNPKNPASSYFQIDPIGDVVPEAHKDFLIQFDQKLPNLNISGVEYAVDLFCRNPQGVIFLNDIIRKYLYAKYQQTVKKLGDKERFGKRQSIQNMVSRLGDFQKVYERGPDNKKKKNDDFWFEEDFDRVRLEFTGKRVKSQLLKFGIEKLPDLIRNPRFYGINVNKWQFKQFKKKANKGTLPRPWEIEGTFHETYLELDKKNRSRSFEPAKSFEILEKKIFQAMQDFNQNWLAL